MNIKYKEDMGFHELKKIKAYLLKGHVMEIYEEYEKNTTNLKQYVVIIDGYFNKGDTDKFWINKFIQTTFDHYKVPLKEGDLI